MLSRRRMNKNELLCPHDEMELLDFVSKFYEYLPWMKLLKGDNPLINLIKIESES
jgi:hypothetical protein